MIFVTNTKEEEENEISFDIILVSLMFVSNSHCLHYKKQHLDVPQHSMASFQLPLQHVGVSLLVSVGHMSNQHLRKLINFHDSSVL